MHTETRLTLAILVIIILGNSLMFFMLNRVLDLDMKKQLNVLRNDKENEIISELKGRVDSAYTVLAYLKSNYSLAEAKEKSKKLLAKFQFGENNYLWVHRMDPSQLAKAKTLVHPAKKFVNRDVTGVIDLERAQSIYFNGRIYEKHDPMVAHIPATNIFLRFNTISFEKGEGVVKYYWPKVKQGRLTESSFKKLSYVKYFPDWHWVIGAGAYADHIDQALSERAQQIELSHQSLINHILQVVVTFSFFVIASVYYVIYFSNKARRRAEKALKDNELQLRTIMKISPVGVIRMSKFGRVIWINHQGSQLIGQNLRCNQRLKWKKLIYKDDYQKIKEQWRENFLNKGRYSFECRFRQPDGSVNWLLIQTVRECTERKHANVVGTLTDITYQKRIENELKDMRIAHLQQEKFASIGQLAAGVAHEINNPIGFISSNIKTLEKYLQNLIFFLQFNQNFSKKNLNAESLEVLTREQQKLDIDYILEDSQLLLNETNEGVKRITNIVGNLKVLSSAERENHIISKIDINQCLDCCINELFKHPTSHIKLLKSYSQIPEIEGFLKLLKQTFQSIFNNAIEAIEKQGEIRVKTWRFQNRICISISDDGRGIEQEQLKNVFDPFFTTKEIGQGTGLGLSIGYDVIKKKHYGEIEINSKKGKGTTIQITLPLQHPRHF